MEIEKRWAEGFEEVVRSPVLLAMPRSDKMYINGE
jgi:hypothetical protein